MLATYYGIKKLVRVIENSSTTVPPDFCGIDHLGSGGICCPGVMVLSF